MNTKMEFSGKSSVPSEQVLADKDVSELFFQKLLNLVKLLALSYLSSPFQSEAPSFPSNSPCLVLPVVRSSDNIGFFLHLFLKAFQTDADEQTNETIEISRGFFVSTFLFRFIHQKL